MIYRNGPKRTFVDTETDSLCTETDFCGSGNRLCHSLWIQKHIFGVLKQTEIQNKDTNFSANQCS